MVGCILSRRKGRGPLVRGGDKTSNQCTRTKRTTICNSILHSKHETLEQHRHSNGQHGRSFLSNEDWATNNQVLVGLSKQIWNYLMSKPFTSSKVSRWIVDMIGQSGTDIDVFKAYST